MIDAENKTAAIVALSSLLLLATPAGAQITHGTDEDGIVYY
jgi:hypothetical protein